MYKFLSYCTNLFYIGSQVKSSFIQTTFDTNEKGFTNSIRKKFRKQNN